MKEKPSVGQSQVLIGVVKKDFLAYMLMRKIVLVESLQTIVAHIVVKIVETVKRILVKDLFAEIMMITNVS